MKAIVIIPARYGSTRLPGKVLLNKTGKYLVQHTYEQALKAREVSRVIIATDDSRVARVVRSFGGEVAMTSRKHTSGTDRIAEVARHLKYPKVATESREGIVVNLQADEPEIDPGIIDRVIRLVRLKGVDIATLACPFRNKKELNDPSKVKVLIDSKGFAINFSRRILSRKVKRHIGIYVYKRARLLEFTQLLPTRREKQERLEQLRALENDFSIKVGIIKKAPVGIDTTRDYVQFVKRMVTTHRITLTSPKRGRNDKKGCY